MFIFIYILVLCFDTSLSWVYKKDRNLLIDEIIDDGHVEAILVKVAGAGLQPAKHLGKSLREMRSAFAMYVITKSLITTTTTKTYDHHRNYYRYSTTTTTTTAAISATTTTTTLSPLLMDFTPTI